MLTTIPIEIQIMIITNLTLKEEATLSICCRELYDIVTSDNYYRQCKITYTGCIKTLLQSISYSKKNIKRMYKNYTYIQQYNNEVFYWVCFDGYLDSAQWLQKKIKIDEDTIYNSFSRACENGHLHIAEWLFETYQTTGIAQCFDVTLEYVCRNGHIKIIKWLISVNPEIKKSPRIINNFKNACFHGHLDVAKYLLEINPDINVTDFINIILYRAHQQNHQDIINWLTPFYTKNTANFFH